MIDALCVKYFGAGVVTLLSVFLEEGLVDMFIVVMFNHGTLLKDISSIGRNKAVSKPCFDCAAMARSVIGSQSEISRGIHNIYQDQSMMDKKAVKNRKDEYGHGQQFIDEKKLIVWLQSLGQVFAD